MRIQPARALRGTLRVPGDKSVSHRAALIAALAAPGARSLLSNFSTSADCASTLGCLEQLGVRVKRDGTMVEIEGAGLRLPRAPVVPLDCGNSGTTARLLAGVLAGQNFTATLTGDSSLRARPMRRVIEPLELMGARVASDEGHAPLTVEGRRKPLRAITYEPPVASAQVKSCVLLAGLNAEGRTTVLERRGATRDHTERLLRWFGVEVEEIDTRPGGIGEARGDEAQPPRRVPSRSVEDRADDKDRANNQDRAGDKNFRAHSVSVAGGQTLCARDVEVPGDISSAAFFIVAAALITRSELRIEGVGLNPTRTQIINALSALGADLGVENVATRANEPVGEIVVRGAGKLAPRRARANILRGELIAGLIDELPILAVAGTQIEGGLEIRDAAELRVKETDRVRAVCENLRAMGAHVEEYDDGFFVAGRTRLRGARVSSFGDHRIAMAFAVAALLAEGETEIEGADCVAVSFPEFFELLESVVER
jgi:3-phosphoshikimate 1-carboxyvinyltransferase